jgi:F420-non-reducing hydrogenase iron-sulfur subunit
MILGCHPGDCHYKEGNVQALKRYTMIKTTISAFGIEEDRLTLDWISASEQDKFVQVVSDMTERIRKLGPLPRRQNPKSPCIGALVAADVKNPSLTWQKTS